VRAEKGAMVTQRKEKKKKKKKKSPIIIIVRLYVLQPKRFANAGKGSHHT